MLKEVELFVALVFLLISVILIFDARSIIRNKRYSSGENIRVNIIKVLGVLMAVASLVFMYYNVR